MPKNDEARERAASERADRLAALFASDTITKGQFDLLIDILIELSNQTGVNVYSPEVVAAFYRAAARKGGAARDHNELAEALRLIEGGETFDDYIGNDGVRLWKLRRRARASRCERSVADALHEALLSTETPDDYRAALTEALRAFAEIAYTGFDEAKPRETFLGAAAELAIWPDRSGLSDARLRICDLLDGLKRKRPLDSIAPRASKQETAPPPRGREVRVHATENRLVPFGIHPGDRLTVEPITEGRPGEVVLMWSVELERWEGIGRFVSMDAKHVTVNEGGDEYEYPVSAFDLYRAATLARTIERPAADAEPPAKSGDRSPEAQCRIEELRRRLDKLYEPECEAARFKLEREIYDLERAPACAVDEWPELVAA